MRIHPIFTQVKDWTDDGHPDGIEALVEFEDRFGDPTKATGTVIFELYPYRPANPDPRGRRLACWTGSIQSLEDQQLRWNRTSRTYGFRLAYPPISSDKSYVLAAIFAPTGGGRFFHQLVLEAQEPRASTSATRPGTTQPSTLPNRELLLPASQP